MSIWLNSKSKVIVQGITGKNGQFHTEQMLDYGTKVIGGVTPGKGSQETLGVPIWMTVLFPTPGTPVTITILILWT